ncbi:Ldh family oxidoreductase [Streptomyces odontomachi]|uniref:Ldh family oxidoreductase n=1 Tax=Streptomyces odontomachi TaxID=2944940 RepID=UPI00210C06B7|nr:Ldh family oxidoreductase [Streptomyces sp. ODS25]
MTTAATVRTVGDLQRRAAGLLRAAGLSQARAERTAQIVVLSEAWGNPSHGLLRLPYYLTRLAAGGCRADADLVPVTDTGPIAVFDGQAGIGHWQLWEAAEIARARCLQSGIAAVGVGNSSHCGALGAYVYPLLDAGLVGLVFSNGPAVMPPWGGATPLLSTSPVAAGIPSRPTPVVIDLATSTVARGKIAAYAQAGKELPEGWALGSDGVPTTDPQLALHGMLAPLGGAKGYALALLVESLTGGLVGPRLAAEVPDMFDPADDGKPQGISHLVIALDPRLFPVEGIGEPGFDRLVTQVQASGGRTPGAARIAPDDLKADTELSVSAGALEQLDAWAERLGVTPAPQA